MQELHTKPQQSLSQANSDEVAPTSGFIIFGFDSAWKDESLGAIGAITIDRDGRREFRKPERVSFDQALGYIRLQQSGYAHSLVAIDQPMIVKNKDGCRPVDRTAGTLLGRIGGGVQCASLKKDTLFGEGSPLWRFMSKLGAMKNPLEAREDKAGKFMIEVFPALALPSLNSEFTKPPGVPKYNPRKKDKFRLKDWIAVTGVVACLAQEHEIEGLETWAKCMGSIGKPEKADQDLLDAAICALVGYLWRFGPSGEVAMIGDLDSGYMITPISSDTRSTLEEGAQEKGAPFHVPN